jgi:ABC-type branched-subunit amino acid transport system substrate-binding protein
MSRSRTPRLAALGALFLLAASACSSEHEPSSTKSLLIAVNAPFSKDAFVGQTIYQGVKLAVDQWNGTDGFDIGTVRYTFSVKKYDNAVSAEQAVANVREAVADGAVAIVDEGTGIDASWPVANAAGVPICIVYQGGESQVDPTSRPNVFRIAPTDHGISFRYAEYLAPQQLKVALMTDDTDYGRQGQVALADAWDHIPKSVAVKLQLPSTATDLSPQVLQARRAGATALLVWARAATIAEVVRAARSSGWDVPVFTPASGEDPLVRQQLADHPDWVDGLTFAAGRMTAERGPGPFLAFQDAYTKAFGRDDTGVKTADGRTVYQPPDYAMYPYDFVNLLHTALLATSGATGDALVHALNEVETRGANGDERGFNEKNHEGVIDDDVYFAAFHDMTYAPVKNDPLSSTLPTIPQT